MLKIQKTYFKNSKSIDKIKTKIANTDISAKLEYFNTEILSLEKVRAEIETRIQHAEETIHQLELDKIKLEGRKLNTELINKLAYMNLKWERSRQIDISDIYKN